MTLLDGSTILSADVNAAYQATMDAARARAADKVGAYSLMLDYRGLLAGTGAANRTQTIVLPEDSWLDEVAATTVDQIGTVTVTVAGAAMITTPITLSAVTGAGVGKLPRYHATDVPKQLLLRGSTITVTVSTTDAAGTQRLDVALQFAVARSRT